MTMKRVPIESIEGKWIGYVALDEEVLQVMTANPENWKFSACVRTFPDPVIVRFVVFAEPIGETNG